MPLSSTLSNLVAAPRCHLHSQTNLPRQIRGTTGIQGAAFNHTPQTHKNEGAPGGAMGALQNSACERRPSLLFPAESVAIYSKLARSPSVLGPGGRAPSSAARSPRPAPWPSPPNRRPPAWASPSPRFNYVIDFCFGRVRTPLAPTV